HNSFVLFCHFLDLLDRFFGKIVLLLVNNGFVGCDCNSHKTGFGNQMKESEASERKKTQTSLFFHLLFYVPC
ncbi:hypothetical protein, partial [Leyella stercorea]|uniref:hypothetical protein n=1 Tax=Leyella stercorea TaxID=363265 RepID=UPI00242D4B40